MKLKINPKNKMNDFFFIEKSTPNWRCFSSYFMGKIARYYDEIDLEVLPLEFPLNENDLVTRLWIYEEHGHSLWRNQLSGVAQAGLSLLGTNYCLDFLKDCIENKQDIHVPLLDYAELYNKNIINKIIGSERCIRKLKENDLFVQEIAFVLITSIYLNKLGVQKGKIEDFEKRVLRRIGKYFTNKKIKQEIKETYYRLKNGIERLSKDPKIQIQCIDCIVKVSLTIYPIFPLLSDMDDLAAWDILYNNIITPGPNNSKHRFLQCIKIIENLDKIKENRKLWDVAGFHSFLHSCFNDTSERIRAHYHYIDNYFSRHTIVKSIIDRNKKRRAEKEFLASAKLHIVKGYCSFDSAYKKVIKCIFGNNPISEIRLFLVGPALILYYYDKKKRKEGLKQATYVFTDTGHFKMTKGIRIFSKWQIFNLILWSIKQQLVYAFNLTLDDHYNPTLSCPFEKLYQCENAKCDECLDNPMSINGWNPHLPLKL